MKTGTVERVHLLTPNEAAYIHSLVDTEDKETRIHAANQLLQITGNPPLVRDYPTACGVLKAALHALLDAEDYLTAAVLCWGTTLFDPRPQSVQLIWHGLVNYPRLLIYGAGSMGKSYTVMAFDTLDYERDPENTTIKLISTTAGHARANTFSTLVRFHRMSAVPLSGYIKQGFIGLDKDDKRSSIAEVAIPAGDDGKGRLQGFHPLPRQTPHPQFGRMTRVRARFDEAEDIPIGVWKGEANMILSMDDEMHVAITAMTNPKRRDSMFAQKAEPIGGWRTFNIEKTESYTSKQGYKVIRLDGAKCENVVQQRIIYPGLLTYEGFKELESQGETSADYWTFARGAYPIEIASYNIFASQSLDGSRGSFIWAKAPIEIGSMDTAREEGGDNAIFTSGKYGLALAFEPEGGKPIYFDEPRWCIQVDQQFPIKKQNTVLMGRDIMRLCRMLRIKAEHLCMDRTGNMTGLHDWLVVNFGDVLGIQWGEGSTELPILEEDNEKACDLYDDIISEMWFAASAWTEFGYIAFVPSMDTARLFGQLTTRRYHRVSKVKRRVNDKKSHKKDNNGESPDEADSFVQMVHLVRQMAQLPEETPAMEPKQRQRQEDDYATIAGVKPGSISSTSSKSVIDKQAYVKVR